MFQDCSGKVRGVLGASEAFKSAVENLEDFEGIPGRARGV